jgi:undecaprenyl phosphate-alpha-L-ara4FN deformylase
MSTPFIGLRIDVDTYRGTRMGAPELVRTLARHEIRASFFFSVGPDNMGRHLWRLLRPAFMLKMLRTRAASLYGWEIVFRGTLWPGPGIGRGLAPVIAACAESGHEIGFHAWDHHGWQKRVAGMTKEQVATVVGQGLRMLDEIGAPATCAASPAWRTTDAALEAKAERPQLAYNSDCRGEGVFTPVVGGRRLSQPQVPVNLPTYDEVVGRDGVVHEDWNEILLGKLRPEGYNVLTIHAEVEGIIASSQFNEFLEMATARGYRFGSLSELVPENHDELPDGRIVDGSIPGREGWISVRQQGTPPAPSI